MGKSNKFSLATKSHSSTRVNPYDKITLNALNISCPDKQILLPRLETDGIQIVFIELYSLFIFLVALGTQYLNLYRSVWWLSKARSNQPINYHLIDLDVSQFSLLFIGQSSLITILKALLNKATTSSSLLLSSTASSSTNSLNNNNNNNNNNHHHHHNNNGHLTQTTRLNQTIPTSAHNTSSATTTKTSNHNNNSHNQNGNNNNNNSSNINNGNNKQETSKASETSKQEDQTNKLTTIVTSSVSWICNYYLFMCAYRIWHNFGIFGLSWISGPIVSICI